MLPPRSSFPLKIEPETSAITICVYLTANYSFRILNKFVMLSLPPELSPLVIVHPLAPEAMTEGVIHQINVIVS